MKETLKEVYMYLLGALIVALCFFLAYLLLFTPIPETNKEILTVALGLILAWGGLIVNYFFGTSKSSNDKTKIMAGVSERTEESKTKIVEEVIK